MKSIAIIILAAFLTAASCTKTVYIERETFRDTTIFVENNSFHVRDSFHIVNYYDSIWIQPYIAENTIYVTKPSGKTDSLRLWFDTWKRTFTADFYSAPDTSKTIRERTNTTELRQQDKPFWEMPALLLIGALFGLIIGFFAMKYLDRK